MAGLTSSPRFALLAAACAILFAENSLQAAFPVVNASPQALFFNYTVGSPAPPVQIVTVSADQPNTIDSYCAPAGPNCMLQLPSWLLIIPFASGPPQALAPGSPVSMMVYIVPNGLTAGTYSTTVMLHTGGPPDPSSMLSFTVYLVVTGGSGGGTNFNETIAVSPSSLAFSFQPGSSPPPAQILSVTTSDNANVTATVNTNDGNPWLSVSPASISTPGTMNVSVSPATLNGGTYTGTVTVAAPNAVTQLQVTFTVGANGLAASPASLTINEPQDYGLSAPQPLFITSTVPTPVSVSTVTDVGGWLQVDINTVTTPATINVRTNDSGLTQGTYTGFVRAEVGPSNFVQVPVTLNIGPPATLSLSPASFAFTYQINDPLPAALTAKVNSLTAAAQTFNVMATTNDGAKWLTATASPNSTPGAVSVGITPAGLAAGAYSGIITVTPTAAGSSSQPILVSLTVKPAPLPVIQSVTSAASYATGGVAPGELVVIFGSHIGPQTLAVAPSGTAPGSLSATSVAFDGIPAPIYYTSSGQTSVQVPYNIASGQTSLAVTYGGVTSAATVLNSLPAFPGLFTSDTSGQHQLAALNADLSVNSPSNPATRGTALVLYGTGEGKTSPPVVEGQRVPVIVPLPQSQLPIAVSIGGQNAPVQYFGETPGLLSGLMQINVMLPLNTPTGSNIPVLVNINGQATQANVSVAIK